VRPVCWRLCWSLGRVVGEAIEEMDRIREKLKWGRLSSRLYEYFEGLPSTPFRR
jgi:hypothetical protein